MGGKRPRSEEKGSSSASNGKPRGIGGGGGAAADEAQRGRDAAGTRSITTKVSCGGCDVKLWLSFSAEDELQYPVWVACVCRAGLGGAVARQIGRLVVIVVGECAGWLIVLDA